VAIFKRGNVYWYHFIFNGQHIQESTKQGNRNVAKQIEAAKRTALAKGEVGIREREVAPSMAEFCGRVESYARAQYEQTSRKTWQWYRFGLKVILSDEMASRKLDAITPEHIAGLVATLQAKEWAVASINSALRAVRRVFRLALKWGVLATTPEITLLRGENHRDRVLGRDEEAKYLAAASEPLASIATVLVDTGLRPEECFRLRWETLGFHAGRFGTLQVLTGKTKAARRFLPLTKRVRAVLEMLWQNAGRPEEGWVWPAPTKQGHVWHDSIRVQHKKALKASGLRPFVVYALRHTFLTRLGESGCEVWTLARIAGHSSIKMSERYVHPSGEAVRNAISRISELELSGQVE
jgi:integrase